MKVDTKQKEKTELLPERNHSLKWHFCHIFNGKTPLRNHLEDTDYKSRRLRKLVCTDFQNTVHKFLRKLIFIKLYLNENQS